MISALFAVSLALATPAEDTRDADVVETVDDNWTEGHLLLGAGVFLGISSLTSFTVGWEAERVLLSERHTREDADALMLRRGLAAWVAWPTAVLSVASLAAGGTLLALDQLAGAE
jgi:hypothetical protein